MNKETKKAAALKYDPERDIAPIISAVGSGYVAEKIVEKAEEHGVPVVHDKPMSEVLSALSVGDVIPKELYEAVAQLLVFVGDYDMQYTNVIKRK